MLPLLIAAVFAATTPPIVQSPGFDQCFETWWGKPCTCSAGGTGVYRCDSFGYPRCAECSCTTACGTTGTKNPSGVCVAQEACNDCDDDADGASDEGLLCAINAEIAACQGDTGLGKVRPAGRPPVADCSSSSGTVHLRAARNEFEGFEVAIFNPDPVDSITNVRADVSDLTRAGAPAIAAARAGVPGGHVFVYRESYINVSRCPSGRDSRDEPLGMWPDALIPSADPIDYQARNAFSNFVVPPRENRAIYVETHVPVGTTPGLYTGTLTVTWSDPASSNKSARLTFVLEVLPFTLESTSSLRTHYGLFNGGICRGHFNKDCSQLTPDELAAGIALKQKYTRALLDHRVSSDVLFEGPARNPLVPAEFDWASFDRSYASLYTGNTFGLLQGARLTSVRFPQYWTDDQLVVDLSSPEALTRTRSFFAEWQTHLETAAPQWAAVTFDYTTDEPSSQAAFDVISTRAPLSIAAGVPSLVPGQYLYVLNAGVSSFVDIFAELINFQARDAGSLATRNSGENWLYQSCLSHGCAPPGHEELEDWCDIGGWDSAEFSGWPQLVVDAKAIQHRAMPWRSYLNHATGELYYEVAGVAGTGRDPWTTQVWHGGHGDGSLVYPGVPAGTGSAESVIGPATPQSGVTPTHIPIVSLRLKHLRDGMEDFEYLKLLEGLPGGGREAAEKFALRVFPYDDRTGLSTMALLRQVRSELADEIIRLGGN